MAQRLGHFRRIRFLVGGVMNISQIQELELNFIALCRLQFIP